MPGMVLRQRPPSWLTDQTWPPPGPSTESAPPETGGGGASPFDEIIGLVRKAQAESARQAEAALGWQRLAEQFGAELAVPQERIERLERSWGAGPGHGPVPAHEVDGDGHRLRLSVRAWLGTSDGRWLPGGVCL